MRCPTLNELPPPPPGKIGWPWTEEGPQLPNATPVPSTLGQAQDGAGSFRPCSGQAGQVASPWPRVSIVTPSYNQGQFIEETIRSVLLQGYPDLEYIIIDGGSTDDSVGIIRKYEKWLAYWVSESDQGQANAINKGWERATGEILAWLNSDDTYCPCALRRVATAWLEHSDAGLIYGICNKADKDGHVFGRQVGGPLDTRKLMSRTYFGQPAVFIPRSVIEEVGMLSEDLHYCLDHELWIRIARSYSGIYLPVALANARMWDGAKTSSDNPDRMKNMAERTLMLKGFFSDLTLPAGMKAAEADAHAFTHIVTARWLERKGMAAQARRELLKAIVTSPGYGWRRIVWPIIFARLERYWIPFRRIGDRLRKRRSASLKQ